MNDVANAAVQAQAAKLLQKRRVPLGVLSLLLKSLIQRLKSSKLWSRFFPRCRVKGVVLLVGSKAQAETRIVMAALRQGTIADE